MKVAKFGGSSLADGVRVSNVCDIVLADPERRFVTVSAPGKASSGGVKVTDLLIACGEKYLATGAADEELERVVSRFAEIHAYLKLEPELLELIRSDLAARLSPELKDHPLFLDGVKAAGEDNCARLVAAALRARGADAAYVNPGEAGLLLSSECGAARVLDESYSRLRKLRDRREIVVFPGFFGATKEGRVVTFPRGGSDISGAVLAAATGADIYENFTDVDSVFAADPRIVPEARPIVELTYSEMRELSYAGFGVFHDEAVLPAIHAGIPIWIRNTGRPDGPGTRIVPKRDHTAGTVAGIASDGGFCSVFVSKYMMNRELGFGRRLLAILEEENLSYEHAPSGIDNMSVILREAPFDPAVEKHVLNRIATELDAEVSVERGLALIMIVGEGMIHAVGVAAKATSALAKAGVNIEMMNQGSSEISMMFGVKAEDRKKAVESLYNAFFGG